MRATCSVCINSFSLLSSTYAGHFQACHVEKLSEFPGPVCCSTVPQRFVTSPPTTGTSWGTFWYLVTAHSIGPQVAGGGLASQPGDEGSPQLVPHPLRPSPFLPSLYLAYSGAQGSTNEAARTVSSKCIMPAQQLKALLMKLPVQSQINVPCLFSMLRGLPMELPVQSHLNVLNLYSSSRHYRWSCP